VVEVELSHSVPGKTILSKLAPLKRSENSGLEIFLLKIFYT
jgi:hypothetical protein